VTQFPISEALDDFVGGLRRWELWSCLAWNDVQQRYRRSFFGPLWTTLSFAVFVAALGPLYANLMAVDLNIYVPHLVLGMLIWQFMSSIMLEGCREFISSANYLKTIDIPYATFIFRLIWRNIVIFLYQFLVFAGAAVLLGITPRISWLPAILGLIIILANAIWLGLLFGMIAARYRDIIEILSSALRVLFFLTPIIWMPDRSERFQILADLNPFFHFIEIFRAPIMQRGVAMESWMFVLIVGAIGIIVTLLFFSRFRNRLPFWL